MEQIAASKSNFKRASLTDTAPVKKRLRGSTIVTLFLVAAVVGAAVGFGVSRFAVLQGMQQTLASYASAHSAASDRYPSEGLQTLVEMAALSLPSCSDAELESFRRFVLKSHFIKDAGRMRGDRLACSATFPAGSLPDKTYVPAFTEQAGDVIYTNMDSLRVGQFTPIVMRRGDYYVALDPYKRDEIPQDVQFSLTMRNAPSGKSHYLGGIPLPGTSASLNVDSQGRSGDYLYATRCSDRFSACITAYITVRETIHDQRQVLWAGVVGGVLAGNFVGLLCMAFYRRTRGIEQQLRRAISHDKLFVAYQPLVDLATKDVVGGEALVRWINEDGFAIPPDVFVKIAEERGFINQITKAVVRHALADFGEYMTEHPEFRINVNISAHDLSDPAFPGMLEEALLGAGVMAPSLGIELTETATSNRELTAQAIARLRDRGHSVYIDDFGTGYSSLSYLRDLSVDGIKIDQSFTKMVGTESVSEGMVPLILAMAQTLGLSTTAEGVETEAHYAYYVATALPLTAQGWFFGQAITPESFHQRWLQSARPLLSRATQS